MRKKILLVLLIALINTSATLAQVVYSDTHNKSTTPNGSKRNPFEISTEKELRDFAKLLENETGEGKYWILKKDINLQGSKINMWNPMSTIDRPFQGDFNGNGYTISGLYSSGSNYLGLFAYVGKKGKVYNLTVTGFLGGTEFIGGVVAMNYGTITNCHNKVTVGGNERVGGIAGYNCGTIANCINTAAVVGKKSVGGILGFNFDGFVYNSINIGEIKGGKTTGGIVGYHGYDNIKTSYTLSGSVIKGSGGENGETTPLDVMKTNNFITKLNDGATQYNNTYSGNTGNTADIEACNWKNGLDGYPKLDIKQK